MSAVPAARPTAAPAAARPPDRPRLRLVAGHGVVARRMPFVVLVIALLGVGLVVLLLLNTVAAQQAFSIHRLQQREGGLTDREQQLARSVADLEAPGALAGRARALGMVPAPGPAFLRLPDGKILGVPQPAATPSAEPAARPPARPSAGPSAGPSARPSAGPSAPTASRPVPPASPAAPSPRRSTP